MLPGAVVLACALLGTGLLSWRRRRTASRIRSADPSTPTGPGQDAVVTHQAGWLSDLGRPLGAVVTFVQFSSAFCAPCRTARQVLGRLAAEEPDVGHVDIDAESHLELVRLLGVRRTPTVLVLDGVGRQVARFTGTPRGDDARRLVQSLRRHAKPAAPATEQPSGS